MTKGDCIKAINSIFKVLQREELWYIVERSENNRKLFIRNSEDNNMMFIIKVVERFDSDFSTIELEEKYSGGEFMKYSSYVLRAHLYNTINICCQNLTT